MLKNISPRIIIIIVSLIAVQFIYSFLFTAHPATGWKGIGELDSYKGYSYDSFDKSLAGKIYPLIANYRMNLDVGGYLLLAHDFPSHYFAGHLTFLTRPLYPFIVHLVSIPLHLISDSYSATFAAGLFVNFVLFFFAVLLFYLLVKKILSPRVALLSSILLIFSPFAHAWLVQPETNIFGAFLVMASLYLFYNYAERPTIKKLIIFSLIIGILMLGKKFFAITFFILILAVYFKRYQEGLFFFVLHLVPFFLWSFWIAKIWRLGIYVQELDFNVVVWLFGLWQRPWYEIIRQLLNPLPSFINAVLYGFLFLPPVLAIVGFPYLALKKKNIIVPGFIFSFFLLFFILNFYIPRHAFLLFPVIYPLAVLGIDRTADYLKRYGPGRARIFSIAVFLFLIIFSSINVFMVFPYDSYSPVWE